MAGTKIFRQISRKPRRYDLYNLHLSLTPSEKDRVQAYLSSGMEPYQLFNALGGKSRRFQLKGTIHTISRRQYDKLNPPVPTSEYNKSVLRSFMNKQRASGHPMSKQEARRSKAFHNVISGMKSTNEEERLAALKALGRRDGIPDWVKPGESHKWILGLVA